MDYGCCASRGIRVDASFNQDRHDGAHSGHSYIGQPKNTPGGVIEEGHASRTVKKDRHTSRVILQISRTTPGNHFGLYLECALVGSRVGRGGLWGSLWRSAGHFATRHDRNPPRDPPGVIHGLQVGYKRGDGDQTECHTTDETHSVCGGIGKISVKRRRRVPLVHAGTADLDESVH